MKPYCHSRNSVKTWGGKPEDYQEIHDFIDSSKAHIADIRHRIFLHNSWGCFLAEKMFGTYITNSDGKKVQTRDIAEQHIIEDLGRIPSAYECVSMVPLENSKWLGGPIRKIKKFLIKKDED